MLLCMDDQSLGGRFRALRIRLGWRQTDLATNAGVARWVVGMIERGRIGELPFDLVRSVARALDVRMDILAQWRGGDLGRLVNAGHAAMHESMARLFAALPNWIAEPEVSFSIFGERGVIDVLAWHPVHRALLIIELKTAFVDINDLMGTIDRKRRLAAQIARDRGWDPLTISVWVVVVDTSTNRRHLARHATVLRSKFPDDGRTVRAWLRDPSRRIDALGFLPVDRRGDRIAHPVTAKRVRHRPGPGRGALPS